MTDYIFALFMVALGNWQIGLLWILAVGLGLIDPAYYGYALFFTALMNIIAKFFNVFHKKDE